MKLPVKYILVLLVFVISKTAIGCNAADQCRLFPLGGSSSGFVFVETHLYRTTDPKGNRYEMVPKWFGESFLKIYDGAHRLISSRLIDSLTLADKGTDPEFIRNSLKKGLVLAKQLPGFIAAKPEYLSYCDFQQKCEEAELRIDTMKRTLFVKLRNQKEYGVNVLKDTTSIAGRYMQYYGFNSDFFDYSDICISSVRRYKVGTETLMLVHLASGDRGEDANGEEIRRAEYKPRFPFPEPGNSVVPEPLLHHGHGFDFFMVE